MTVRDRNTLDLTHQKLRIAPDVQVWPVQERGEIVYRLEIPKLHRFFRVGHEEYVFLSLLDGNTSIPQACGLAASKLGSRAPTANQAKSIGRWLLSNGLAHLSSDPPPRRNSAVDHAANQPNSLRRLLGKFNPFWIKVPLPFGDRWINACSDACGFLFGPRSVLLGVFLVVVATIVLLSNWTEFRSSSTNLIHPGNWIYLLVTWIGLKVIHELAHAIVCNRQGGSVRETGFVFILFAPLAYVDVSSCWRMASRWSRIAVASAGMYIELVIAAVAVLLWHYVDAPNLRFLLHNLVFVAGLSTILFNANALMRFDGYFILADLIEIPNLYGEGSRATSGLFRRLITGETPPAGTLDGWRKHFVLAYGLAALFWRITICISLAIAASAMFAGAGILLTMFGISVWIGGPLSKLCSQAVDLRRRSPGLFLRASGTFGLTLFAGIGFVVWFPIPTSISVPAVVQYMPDTIVRCRTSGFIVGVHVRDGAKVRQGDLLIELENRSLSNDLKLLQIERAQNEVRLRQATGNHDAGQRQILVENQQAVSDRIDQLEIQVAALKIRAPRRGSVVARRLHSKLGTFFKEGDPLLVVAGEADKEVVAMIRHSAIDDARSRIGSNVSIRTASFVPGTGRLNQIEPRASDDLPVAALAATEGGSLAVRQVSDADDREHLKLLQPHFRCRVSLDPATAKVVPAGSRTEVWLGFRNEPIYTRVHRRITELWRSARDDG